MESTNSNVTSSLISVNPRWLAPEILKETGYSKASDVYRYSKPPPPPSFTLFLRPGALFTPSWCEFGSTPPYTPPPTRYTSYGIRRV